ncbi:unnamed protein product [Prunus armeniaca]|uniref:Uncharacterized protein n=1 Tax=Prunus armeniaca TaxID=36596 RepID=A0A6J5XA86_PRUAR|nr:unnamed protein product [Prunus armeniaca]
MSLASLQSKELLQRLKPHVDFHAGGFADVGEEEVYGVKEEALDADDEKFVVPEGHAFGSRFEDLVPPRVLLPELEWGREVADASGGSGVRVECVNHFGEFSYFWDGGRWAGRTPGRMGAVENNARLTTFFIPQLYHLSNRGGAHQYNGAHLY